MSESCYKYNKTNKRKKELLAKKNFWVKKANNIKIKLYYNIWFYISYKKAKNSIKKRTESWKLLQRTTEQACKTIFSFLFPIFLFISHLMLQNALFEYFCFYCSFVFSRAEIEVIETFSSSSSNTTDSFAFTLFDGGNYLKALLLKMNGTEIAK